MSRNRTMAITASTRPMMDSVRPVFAWPLIGSSRLDSRAKMIPREPKAIPTYPHQQQTRDRMPITREAVAMPLGAALISVWYCI